MFGHTFCHSVPAINGHVIWFLVSEEEKIHKLSDRHIREKWFLHRKWVSSFLRETKIFLLTAAGSGICFCVCPAQECMKVGGLVFSFHSAHNRLLGLSLTHPGFHSTLCVPRDGCLARRGALKHPKGRSVGPRPRPPTGTPLPLPRSKQSLGIGPPLIPHVTPLPPSAQSMQPRRPMDTGSFGLCQRRQWGPEGGNA